MTVQPITAIEVRVVFFRGSSKWVAQCLEYDIATQADSLEQLETRLVQALNAEVEFSRRLDKQAFTRLPKAPERYWAMWRGATDFDAKPWKGIPVHLLPKIARPEVSAR